MKKSILYLGLFLLIFTSTVFKVKAIEPTNDCVIRNLNSNFVLNKDASLDVIEEIKFDCGNLPNKHGLFRIISNVAYTDSQEQIYYPIKLTNIADEYGKNIHYKEDLNTEDKTISWRIGDADKTIRGINYYKITYKVENTVRPNDSFDELYWNLNGNFWQLPIENFQSKVTLPEGTDQYNAKISLYSGQNKTKSNNLANYYWENKRNISLRSDGLLNPGEGITLSASFPKNIVTVPPPPATPTNTGLSDAIFDLAFKISFIISILTFIICFILWYKIGRDPKEHKAETVQFDIPDNLSPMQMGVIMDNCKLKSEYISAEIINLATKGIIKIKEIKKDGVFDKQDFSITRLNSPEEKYLSPIQMSLLNHIFSCGHIETLTHSTLDAKSMAIIQPTIRLSSLKDNFYTYISTLEDNLKKEMISKKYFKESGFNYRNILRIIGIIFLVLSLSISFIFIGLLPASIILLVFSFLMPSRTITGANLLWRINGFKLYMKTAEKYRQQFNEKENIFEKLLPYAMIFDITKLWIKKMKDIYGGNYFKNYHPVWYAGTVGNFDFDTFSTSMSHLSSNISSTVASSPSSSGSGGGGFSGGGGGGGGGGGVYFINSPIFDPLINSFTYLVKPLIYGTKTTDATSIYINGLNEGITFPTVFRWQKNVPLAIGKNTVIVKACNGTTNCSSEISKVIYRRIVGDVNADNKVNDYDLSLLANQWLQNKPESDFNADKIVNDYDLSLMVAYWTR